MTQDRTTHVSVPPATVFGSYRLGWRAMKTYFLELVLLTAAMIVLTVPTIGLWGDNAAEFLSGYVSFNLIFFKITGAPGAVLFSLTYTCLLEWPLQYGVDYASLAAARSQTPKIGLLFSAFRNYWNAVLANLLVVFIAILGFVMLLVPGIVWIVRMVFVPYLVVERNMEAVEAVKASWHMTRGYGWRIFGMGLLAIPIALAGFLLLGVGIIVSLMWINVAFASLYQAVSAAEASKEHFPAM